jgi:hypothetical protein
MLDIPARVLTLEDITMAFQRRMIHVLRNDPSYIREQLKVTVDSVCHEARDELVVKFQRPFFKSESTFKTISYPETWWDAFKERWFPRWAMARWPVTLTKIEIEKAFAFPNIEAPPNCGRYWKMVSLNHEPEYSMVEDEVEDLKYFSCTWEHCPKRERIGG